MGGARDGKHYKNTHGAKRNWTVTPRAFLECALQTEKTGLGSRRDVCPAILLVTGLIRIGTDRTVLAEADDGELVAVDSHGTQEFFGSLGAPVAEGHVVLFRTALIAIPFNNQLLARIVGQDVANDAHIL